MVEESRPPVVVSDEKLQKFENFGSLLAEEHACIAVRRGGHPPKRISSKAIKTKRPAVEGAPEDSDYVFDTIGLALSGGGIRSAAVCMGAAQALAKHDLFPKVDYLSTVSGGGYTGAAITLGMSNDKGKFPFFGKDEKRDTEAMREFRENANYLRAGHFLEMAKNLSVYLRGLAANILCLLPVLFGLAAITLFSNPTVKSLDEAGLAWSPDLNGWLFFDGAFGVTKTVLLLTLVIFAIWAVSTFWKPQGREFSSKLLKAAVFASLFLVAVLFCEFQPLVIKVMIGDFQQTTDCVSAQEQCGPANAVGPSKPPEAPSFLRFLMDWIVALGAPVLAFVAFVSKYIGDFLKAGESGSGWPSFMRKATAKAVIWLAALILPLFVWLSYLTLVYWGIKADRVIPRVVPHWLQEIFAWARPLEARLPDYATAPAVVYTVATLLFGLSWFFLTANGNSLHRLYRDRLSDAFCFSFSNGKPVPRGKTRLSAIDTRIAPYPLINTALNIHGSEVVNRSGRNADFFIFSPTGVGSPATGYVRTAAMEAQAQALYVDTAVAVSGAAVSSNMGAESVRALTPTLALLNFRLGYWMRNPLHVDKIAPWRLPGLHLFEEIFRNLDERSSNIYLSDGGHIENLGVYELLRRRCQLIMVIDAEADREMNFGALIALQRYARIDLGARIDLSWSKIREKSLAVQKGGGAASPGPHCAIGKIEYDGGGEGILIYVKSSMTGDENDYVMDYNRRYHSFPHETTGDQFFNEEQFEAYRALGFHAANGLLSGEHLVQTGPDRLESLRDASAKGFGVVQARKLLGLGVLPKSKLPKMPASKALQ